MKNFNFGNLRKTCVLRQVRNENVYFTWERCGLFPFSLLSVSYVDFSSNLYLSE